MSEMEGHDDEAVVPSAGGHGWMGRRRARRSDRRDIRADRRARRRARMFGSGPDDAARQAESHAMTRAGWFSDGSSDPRP
jgi:hypothetical protein